MDIRLTPELEQLVHRNIDTGRFGSASEVIGEALRLLEERDRLHAFQAPETRDLIAAGVASLRAGRTVDGEAVFDRLNTELDAEERRG